MAAASSNHVAMGAINFVAMLLSIPIIGAGMWLSSEADNSCVKILQWPVIILGVVVLVVGLAGFIGAFWRVSWLMISYLVAMLVVIIIVGCFVVFIYMVTMKGSGHAVPSRAYLEYHLDDFSGWLRGRVSSPEKWDKIRSCLSSKTTCAELDQRFRMAQDFFNAHITPLQSGCCKPPTQCGHTFVNPTYWISPINTAAEMDCLQWNNEQTQLCYSCDSCKAGLLANLNTEWRRADVILLISLVALISVYLMSCCAFRKTKTKDLLQKYNQGYS